MYTLNNEEVKAITGGNCDCYATNPQSTTWKYVGSSNLGSLQECITRCCPEGFTIPYFNIKVANSANHYCGYKWNGGTIYNCPP